MPLSCRIAESCRHRTSIQLIHLKVTEPGYLKGRYANQVRITRDKQMRYFLLIIPGETAKR